MKKLHPNLDLAIEKKTGFQYLKDYFDGSRSNVMEEILQNTQSQNDVNAVLIKNYDTFRNFLMSAFNWNETPQGQNYWLKVLWDTEIIIFNFYQRN
jgi:hypothetical protein